MSLRDFGRIVLLLSILSLSFMVPHSPFFARAGSSTIYVPQQYPTIQRAVDAANPGDTIIVSPSPSGTYPGNITISKSLTLAGTSSSSVIINGSNTNSGIIINATSGVSISQITIVDPDSAGNGISILSSLDVSITGIIVSSSLSGTGAFGVWLSNSNNVVLSHDTIGGNLYGVAVQGGFSNSIRANNLTGNRAADVFMNATTGNQVKGNILAKSQIGIDLLEYSSRDRAITSSPRTILTLTTRRPTRPESTSRIVPGTVSTTTISEIILSKFSLSSRRTLPPTSGTMVRRTRGETTGAIT